MLNSVMKEWRYFLLAVGFFTRIPVPDLANFEAQQLNHSAKYFPLVGIIVGIAGAVVLEVSAKFLPINVAVLLSMIATIVLTGAFHEDGLADSMDGMGGGWNTAQILTIMQDSRLGTFGALALFLILFTKFQVLSALPLANLAYVLVAAHALSRLCAVYVMATLRYVKTDGKSKPLATAIKPRELGLATFFGLLPLLPLSRLLCADAAALLFFSLCWFICIALIGGWWHYKIKYWLGGYTGDCLGAMQQMTELAFYLGILIYSGFNY